MTELGLALELAARERGVDPLALLTAAVTDRLARERVELNGINPQRALLLAAVVIAATVAGESWEAWAASAVADYVAGPCLPSPAHLDCRSTVH